MKYVVCCFYLLGAMLVFTACLEEPSVILSTTPSVIPTPTEAPTSTVASTVTEEAGENRTDGILSSFTTTDIFGNEVTQSIFDDYQLIMINIWATFCGPCIDEMPDLGALAVEYADKGAGIVGIAIDITDDAGDPDADQVELAKEIVIQTGADYLHLQPSDDLSALLSQITAVPTTFFVDQDGVQVGGAYLGSRSKEDWATIIEELLQEVQ